MELLAALRARHSIRLFRDLPVSDSEIHGLCDAAALAPSSMNSQPWQFHVATGVARERACKVMALSTQYLQEYIDVLGAVGVERAEQFYGDLGGAPVVIAVSVPVLADPSERDNVMIAVGAAVENFMLAALEQGLGSCNLSVPRWVVDELMTAFDIAEDRMIATLVILGHPDEAPPARDRRHDVVTFVGR